MQGASRRRIGLEMKTPVEDLETSVDNSRLRSIGRDSGQDFETSRPLGQLLSLGHAGYGFNV